MWWKSDIYGIRTRNPLMRIWVIYLSIQMAFVSLKNMKMSYGQNYMFFLQNMNVQEQ